MEKYGVIKDLAVRFASEAEDQIAVCVYDGARVRDITYRSFAEDIRQAAGYFVNNSIKNQHIAIAAPNSYDWLVVFFAVITSGNVAVMMNPELSNDILLWQTGKADISVICGEEDFLSSLDGSFDRVAKIPFSVIRAAEPVSLDMLTSAQPDDTIIMLFTSGTTGKSKVVEVTSRNWRYVMDTLVDQFRLEGMDRICIPVPFHHTLGLHLAVMTFFYDRTVCIGRGIKYLFFDMAALNPGMLVAVPSVVESLEKVLRRAKTPEDRQKILGNHFHQITYGGAALKEPVLRTFLDHGVVMCVNYGMTEIAGGTSWGIVDRESRYRTAGKFTAHTQCRFEDGELLLKTPALMKGYYKDPEETAKIIEDGWIHTGDLGRLDEDGYFFLTGRKKNVIILPNGENVNPEEIENNFGVCADILECMVYGDGKGICADIYTENQDAVKAFVKEYNKGTPLYRQVYKVNYSAVPLEKTGSGKIKRKVNIYE